MEDKEGISLGGVTVKGDEAPDSYCIAPRTENPSPFTGHAAVAPTSAAASIGLSSAPAGISAVSGGLMAVPATATVGSGSDMKKKRGRPRKYGPDGTLTPAAAAAAAAAALSPMPISSSIPIGGDFPVWKRGRGRSVDSIKKHHKFDFESPGERLAYFVGANFTPHVITVNAGEDVMMKIMLFSQQGSRAICVLSANGTISNVTLRQPTSSGGTLTYEGRFEILSLSGSLMPNDDGVARIRSGGMSVSLAGPDGRVVGGGLAGLLIAAGPVQVVVGSFLPGHQLEHKNKKQKMEAAAAAPAPAFTITPANAISAEELKTSSYGGAKPIQSVSSFQLDRPAGPVNPAQPYPSANTDTRESSSPGDESRGTTSQSNCELSC